MTLELNVRVKDAGHKGMVMRNSFGRVRQDRNTSSMFWRPVWLKHDMETGVL